MEQDNLKNEIKSAKNWAMAATITSVICAAGLVYVIVDAIPTLLKLPKPDITPKYELFEMTFTEEMQKRIFSNERIVEVKFEWVPGSARADTTPLTLTAVGGYMDGENLLFDEANRVTLDPGKRGHYADASLCNYDSPIYFTRGDIKAFHKIDAEGSVSVEDIGAAILMTPFTTSDATRRYCLYYGGSTSYESRLANPAPPFTSPCLEECDR